MRSLREAVSSAVAQGEYANALGRLAQLRPPVDAFFEQVMVMADDPKLRDNRLALLAQLHGLFVGIAICLACQLTANAPSCSSSASMLYTVFLFAWTFCYSIFFVIACSFLPFRKRFVLARVWARVLLWALNGLAAWITASRARKTFRRGNHIALWKHSSSWETIAMAIVFPRQVWVLKRELLWVPVVGWGIRQPPRHRHRPPNRGFRRESGGRAGQTAPAGRRLDHYLP